MRYQYQTFGNFTDRFSRAKRGTPSAGLKPEPFLNNNCLNDFAPRFRPLNFGEQGKTIFFQFFNAPASGDDIVKTIDTHVPLISEVTPVGDSVTTQTPNYTFTTNEAGTITYFGDCFSSTTDATVGSNTITFNKLAAGFYGNCALTVTNAAGNVSSSLNIISFTIAAGLLVVITPTPNTPSAGGYQFTRQLSYGMSGDDVKQLQIILVAKFFSRQRPTVILVRLPDRQLRIIRKYMV